MKKRVLTVLAVLLVFSFISSLGNRDSSLAPETSESSQASECSQLATARKILADAEEDLAERYEAEYFESSSWTGFVDGYWQGFWREHQYCKQCRANGDVPTEYTDVSSTELTEE